MENLTSIRWHSRAGQGAITAATALAEILGTSGKFVQSFPEFGAEKRGAPVTVFNRIADEPITVFYHPKELDAVVLLDTSLVASCELTAGEVLANLKKNGKLIVNTTQEKLKFAAEKDEVFVLDASGIAVAEIDKDIPNVPILGGLVAILGLTSLEEFLPKLEKYLAAGLPAKIVAGNLRAFERGFKEVKKV